jgi:imidazole glycerol-phosphate synthase subunit HisH
MIAIIDCGCGNLNSVKKALDYLGVSSVITNDSATITSANRIILPGVGSFGYFMKKLREKNLEEPIKDAILKGVPFLGICLGLQVLFEQSEESQGVKGFEIFAGNVKKFVQGKIPQIGWNKIKPKEEKEKENQNIFNSEYMYFVNSYYVVPKDESIVAATSGYYKDFTCAIQKDNVTAVQFHPEKSGKAGISILRKWLAC